MAAFSEFLWTNSGGNVVPQVGVWVEVVNNASGLGYVSIGATDSFGKFTLNPKPPPGYYSVFTAASNLPPLNAGWISNGDTAFQISYTALDDISANHGDFAASVRMAAGPLYDVTNPSFAGGAVADCIELTDGAITAATKAFASTLATFTANDVGKRLVCEGAGLGGLSYADTIAAFVDSHHVTMTNNALTTVSGKQFAYGTKNGAAFIAAKAAAETAGLGTPYVPKGSYMVELQVASTVGFFFDGSVIYAGLNVQRLFAVTGTDVVHRGRMTYVGMNLATDGFGGLSQVNTHFKLHATMRRGALPLATPGVPSLVAQAGATNLTAGNYTGLVTYVDASGVETGGVGFTLVGVTAGQQILYTASSVPANVTSVRFYLASSTAAGATLGLLATVTPASGSATYTQVLITAGVGGATIIPGGNATGNVLINMILSNGCKCEGYYTSLDSALIRLEGGRDLESSGIKAGPYTRDPQQYIAFIGDIFGTRPQITNASMHDHHVDGGNLLTKSVLVVAQAYGGGTHVRNVKVRDLSVDFTASLADGVDIIQCDQVEWANIMGNGVTNALNISGCTQVEGGGGNALNCRGAGLMIGDPTVIFTTNIITVKGWTSIDCGLTGGGFGAAGVVIFAAATTSTNLVKLSDVISYKSANPAMLYGLGIGGGGTFSLIEARGGFLLGQNAAYLDSSGAAPAIIFKDVGNVSDTFTDYPQVLTPPVAPLSGYVRDYGAKVSGRVLPAWIGSDNAAYLIGPALFSPKVIFWQEAPGGNTGNILGSLTAVGAGTFAAVLPTNASLYTIVKRGTWKTVVTTLNQTVGIRMNELCIFLGGSVGQGGFFAHCIFGLEAWTAGNRMFIGLTTSATPVAGQPSAMTNFVGLGIDAGDTAFTFMHAAAGAATKDAIAGQPALAANQGYAFWMYNPPNSALVFYRLDNLNTGANIIESFSSTAVPVAATMMQYAATAGNAANAGAAAAGIGVSRFYVDTYF